MSEKCDGEGGAIFRVDAGAVQQRVLREREVRTGIRELLKRCTGTMREQKHKVGKIPRYPRMESGDPSS